MTQEIEIEFKNQVTKTDFHKLLRAFNVHPSELKTQINYYFDTANFQLKTHGAALRIREKNNEYTLTLKQPNQIGLLETHQKIKKSDAETALQVGLLPKGIVANQLLSSFNIDRHSYHYFGSLATDRAQKSYASGIIVFDHSFYLGIEDYEIEYEVSEEQQGKIEFQKLFYEYSIPIKHTDNKIKRFLSEKQTRKM